MPCRRFRGFTLVELLVVIAIIGILIALLLPAVQAAREAARRIRCTNNIHQLAVALCSYHSSHNRFPAGAYCPFETTQTGGIVNCHTWIETLFPFIEQSMIYERIDFTRKNNEGTNPDVLNGLVIDSLMCPSDPDAGLMDNGREQWYLPGTAGTFSLAQSYAPSGGPLEMNACLLGVQGDYNCQYMHGGDGRLFYGSTGSPGMFAGGPWTYKVSDCTDGASHTFLLGETLPIYSTFMMYFSSHMNVASTNPPPNHWKTNTECPRSPLVRQEPCYAYMGGFNSAHPGGVTMGMTDGSVQFINDDVDYLIWTHLGDRKDGQTIAAGEY